MKKLLLLLAFVPSALFGKTMVKDVNEFMNMHNKHMTQWLNLKKKKFSAEIDLINKQENQKLKLHQKHINMVAEGVPAEKLLSTKLHEMINLVKDQAKEWADMCKANSELDKKTAEKQMAEFNDFVKRVMPEIEMLKQGKIEVRQYGQAQSTK